MPTSGRVVDPHVFFEVRHVLNQFVKGDTDGGASAPGLRFGRAEDEILSFLRLGSVISEAVNQPLDLPLVRDQHFADDAETAGLPQRDQSEWIDVNDQWNLADASLRLTPRASGESLAGIGIEDE